MPLKVFNTRSRSLEDFETVKPGLVRMYVCGPTVYEHAHLGHARSYVVYDAVRRFFRKKGYEVEHVQNFTDVEESIARRAREAGLHPLAYADAMILAFLDDMDALRILRADHYPRVSENIEEIQRLIHDLVEEGFAYFVDCHPGSTDEETTVCDVYFDVEKSADFGALIGQNPDELAVDAVDRKGDRRHPMDFALWKSRDDWGVTWPSPWGDGRPGWHVECAAMSLKYLGTHFDIHGGGLDLVFPHHESERVLGEAWTNDEYVTFFLHNGFVTVGDKKMSKSKDNFVRLRDLVDRVDPEVLRVFLLSEHYRSPLDFGSGVLEASAARLARWREVVAALRARAAEGGSVEALDPPLREARDAFWAALERDFRFGDALDALDLAAERSRGLSGADASHALAFFRDAADVLGILWELESFWEEKPPLAMVERA